MTQRLRRPEPAKWAKIAWAALAIVNIPIVAAAREAAPAKPDEANISFLKRADRKPIPIDLSTGLIAFQTEINGVKGWAILDNLAARSAVDLAFARAAEIEIGPRSNPIAPGHGPGYEQVEAYRLLRPLAMKFPGQMTATAPLLATDLRSLPEVQGGKIVLMIGHDFFRHLAFAVDFRSASLQIGPSGTVGVGSAFTAIQIAGPRATLPLGVEQHSLLFDIDLGSNGGLAIKSATWDRIGLVGGNEVGFSRNISGEVYSFAKTELPKLSVGPFLVEKMPGRQMARYTGKSDGIAGMALLRKFDAFALDIKQNRLWLLPKEKKSAPQ